MSRTIVFIHGSGRSGAANWPNQLSHFADAAFLTMPGYGDESPTVTNMDDWVDRAVALKGELDVVGHAADPLLHKPVDRKNLYYRTYVRTWRMGA